MCLQAPLASQLTPFGRRRTLCSASCSQRRRFNSGDTMRSSQSRVVAALAPLLLLLLIGPTSAADPPPAPQKTPAEPGYLAHFREGDTTLLVINDPLPHLRRLLTSERLRKATRSGKIGELLRKESPKGPPDPRDGWAFIERNQRWVPQEVALGIGEQGCRRRRWKSPAMGCC